MVVFILVSLKSVLKRRIFECFLHFQSDFENPLKIYLDYHKLAGQGCSIIPNSISLHLNAEHCQTLPETIKCLKPSMSLKREGEAEMTCLVKNFLAQNKCIIF